MACEKAVIATPVGGMLDILEDGKNGMLINVNDANALAKKVMELLDNSEMRCALGKNARDLVVGKFSLDNELQANLNLYRALGLNVT